MTIPAHLKASRKTVQYVRCPECGAEPRIACTGVRGSRTANHQGRISTFVAWRDKVLKGHAK